MINGLGFLEYLEKYGKTEEHSWEELATIYGMAGGGAAKGVWRRYREAKELKKSYQPKKESLADKLQKSDNFREVAAGCYIAELEDQVTAFSEDLKKGEAEMSARFATEIQNLEELIARTKIDTKVWEITKYVQNYWGNSSNPHWQVKAFLSKRTADSAEIIEGFLRNYTSTYKPIGRESLHINECFTNPTCVFIGLTDVHLDKQTVDGQTIEFKIKKYHEVLDMLLKKSYYSCNIEEIVFTIGHDLFNTDTFLNTTTNGTQQYNNTEFDQSYEKVFESQITAINKLKQFCRTLHVKYIPSNHARTKEYFLVHALSIYFQADKNIVFDRSADSTKVHIFGENFLGMHHGDTKLEKLPSYFSQKYYKQWGMARYKEILTGDKHTRKGWNTDTSEVEGIRVIQTPHMGGHGQWDKTMMYDNGIQAGICRMYDKTKGYCGEIEERI